MRRRDSGLSGARPDLVRRCPTARQTNGHLITFDWRIGQMGFVAQLSLFNTVTYQVRICPNYRGIWLPDLRRGHHFDVEGRTIEPLLASPLLSHR